MRRRARALGVGALLALAALVVLGPLAIYEWAAASAERLPDQSAPSPENQDPPPASSPVEPAEPPPAAAERAEGLRVGEPGSEEPGPLSPAQEQAINQGYLVPDQDAYERFKNEADAKAG